jgi:hypothetical protein
MSDIELAGSYIGKATEINSMLRGLFKRKLPKGSTYWQQRGIDAHDAKRLKESMSQAALGDRHFRKGRGRFAGGLPSDAKPYSTLPRQGKDAEDAFKNRPGVRDRRPGNRSRPTSHRPGSRPNRNWKSNKRAQHLSDVLDGILEFAAQGEPHKRPHRQLNER